MNLKSYFCCKLLNMKKFFGFVVIIFFFNACNDGDVAIQDISFENVIGANCDKTVYKIKGNEIIFFKITEDDLAFINDQTEKDIPRKYFINSKNTVTYRTYNSAVTGANVCAAGTATPSLVEEWTATGGTIEITSTVSKTIGSATIENANSETIDGYNMLVIFKNVTFKKPNGEQFYEEFRFGNFKPSFNTLSFSEFSQQPIKKCSTNSNLTSKIGLSSLISFDNSVSGLILNSPTPINSPRTVTITGSNKLFYRVFENLNLNTYECAKIYLATDTTLKQEWVATTGSVEVTTTTSGGSFIHKIYLKGVKFKRGNSEFYLGDKFLLGELTL